MLAAIFEPSLFIILGGIEMELICG